MGCGGREGTKLDQLTPGSDGWNSLPPTPQQVSAAQKQRYGPPTASFRKASWRELVQATQHPGGPCDTSAPQKAVPPPSSCLPPQEHRELEHQGLSFIERRPPILDPLLQKEQMGLLTAKVQTRLPHTFLCELSPEGVVNLKESNTLSPGSKITSHPSDRFHFKKTTGWQKNDAAGSG